MRVLFGALTLFAVSAIPVASFGQDNGTVTRAQLREELIELEQAGYHPGTNDIHYPDDIQAAEAKVAAQRAARGNAYGSDSAGASESGVQKTGN